MIIDLKELNKYDGWIIKGLWGEQHLMLNTFHALRTCSIKKYEDGNKGMYRHYRRKGDVLAVKVRLTEVVK